MSELHETHSCEQQTASRKASFFGLARNLCVGPGKDVQLVAWMVAALGCGFLAYVARVHEVTHDAFHEMSLYRESLVLGDFPQEDVFAYTPTVSPSVHHEWATGAVLYFVTIGTGLGLAGLSLFKLLMMATLWLLLYRVARMRGAHPYVFALIAFFTFPVFWVGFATVRAQLFTLVFLAAQLWMQELDWRGRRLWVLAWLPMLVAWLNIHAGFVVGLGLIAFHGVERFAAAWHAAEPIKSGLLHAWRSSWRLRMRCALKATWHLLVAAPLAALATLINPYGWQYIPYLVRAIGMERPEIREWKPLWHTYMPGLTLMLFALSVGLYLYAQGCFQRKRTAEPRSSSSISRRLFRLRGLPFLVLCTYMSLKHIRHGSIYGVMWIAYVPAWFSHTPLGRAFIATMSANRQPAIRVCQAVVATCLAFSCWHHFWLPTLPPKQMYSTACYPTGAVEFLKDQQFEGNLMTPFHVGAYVSWEMYPQVKVSFDGRYEVAYQEHIMPEHNQFLDGEGNWWEILDKYPTDAAIIHQQAAVVEKLDVFRTPEGQPTEQKWRYAYEDDSFIVIVREGTLGDARLPYLDRRGVELQDGAWEAFSSSHSHWRRLSKQSVDGQALAKYP